MIKNFKVFVDGYDGAFHSCVFSVLIGFLYTVCFLISFVSLFGLFPYLVCFFIWLVSFFG